LKILSARRVPTSTEVDMSGTHFSLEDTPKLLDIDQVGEILGLTREAIYGRRRRDDFPPAIRVGNVLRWRIEDVEAWLDERREVQP
jgi:predicted DNA-binding transcriptional regulator AlpA